MGWLFPWLLLLHVLGAIVAFGPVYVFPIIGAMGGSEPQHANFASRVSAAISQQRVFPLAIFQGITGVGLILVTGINLLATPWLLIAIVLYLITIGYNFIIQTPTSKKIIEMTSTPPPPGASGPPPELLALIRRIQLGGIFSALMIVLIVTLMVIKPQF
jgi:uncharacterized membrane protein